MINHGFEIKNIDSTSVFIGPSQGELDEFATGEGDVRLRPVFQFELGDRLGSVLFSLPLFLRKLGIDLMVGLVPLCDDGVVEIWAPMNDVGLVLYLAGDAFAKVVQVAVNLLGYTLFERIHFVPANVLPIKPGTECWHLLPVLEIAEDVEVGVVIVLSSLSNNDMKLLRVYPSTYKSP